MKTNPLPLPNTTLAGLACSALAAFAFAATSSAQSLAQSPSQAPQSRAALAQPSSDQPPTEGEPVEFAATPFELSGLGMRFRLPVGTTATARRLGRETHADIVGPDSEYRITVSSRASSNTTLTSEAAAEAILLNLKQAYGITDGDADQPSRVAVATYARELRTVEPVAFPGGVAHRFFMLQPETRSTPETVRGVAVIDLGEGRMLVWDATSEAAAFERLARAFDAMLSTISFDDPDARVASRGLAITAGTKLFEQLSTDDLRSVVEAYGERWFRLYEPRSTGRDEEVAYRRISARLGTRADMTDRGRIRGEADRQPGYIVSIDARTLGPADPAAGDARMIYDSRAVFWVSEDFTSEAWQITVAIKQGRHTSSFSEVGARDGYEQIVVTTQSPNGTSDTVQHRIEQEGYLPTPMAILLPHLLAKAETPGDFAFYAYRSDASTVSYRTDTLRKNETGSGWVLRSTLSPGTPPLARFLDDTGAIIKEQLPDGKVWEPIELRRLAELWRRSGLPME